MNVAVFGIENRGFAAHGVAVFVFGLDFPQRSVTADVAPTHFNGNNRGARGFFHHRIIERNRRRESERFFIDAQKIEVGVRFFERLVHRFINLGRVKLQFGQKLSGAKHESAAVPQKIRVLNELSGALGIGFLDEARDEVGARWHFFAALDISVSGFGLVGHDADAGQVTVSCGTARDFDGSMKCGHVPNRVVGRENQKLRFGVALKRVKCGERHGGRGVAREWFDHKRRGRDIDGQKLVGHQKAVLLIANHNRRGLVGDAAQTLERILQQAVIGKERQKLFGQRRARKRPQPRAKTAA